MRVKDTVERGLISAVLLFGLLGGTAPTGGNPSAAFDAAVTRARMELTFGRGVFGGPGAATIAKTVADAQYVMIGEDHGIAEIAAFSTALCAAVAPLGFNTLALEVGPSTAKVLTDSLIAADPTASLASYDREHPFSIAFYDFSEEYAFLRACRDSMGRHFAMWGLDQELMGSSGALLAAALASATTPQERGTLQALIAQDNAAFSKAMKTGDPGDMAMVNFDEERLASLQNQLAASNGDAAAIAELLASERIYREYGEGGAQSNLNRTRLHRSHFLAYDRSAFAATGTHPKVLVKMGAYHLFYGTSMLGDLELGNFLYEYAALQGTNVLNILILAPRGQQLAFAGIGRPYAPVPLDLLHDPRGDFSSLAPFVDHLGATPVIYDLRTLRRSFATAKIENVNLERILYGYDLLVVIPVAHPSHQI